MEKEVIQKVKRFVELSFKFSKSENDVFKPKESQSNNVSFGWTLCDSSYNLNLQIDGRSLYVDKDGIVKASDNKPVTRAEKILAEAEQQAQLSKEFDEYCKLKESLNEYFKAVDKVVE